MAITRRLALASTAAVALLSAPGRAAAASYAPGSYPATSVLPEDQRHLVGRFSYGLTPALRDEVVAAGTARTWFEEQLAMPATSELDGWWPDLALTAEQIWQRSATGVREGWQVMADYGRRLLARRITTQAQLREVLTEFWENHFHIPTTGDAQFPHRVAYGDLIHTLALGSFTELLQGVVTHPAMTIYLSGYDSTKAHPNENLGREVLELHTVGVGNFTEDDVKNAARILTGFHVDMWQTFTPSYQPQDHWTGPVSVLGFSSANAEADGRPVVTALLDYLAHHELTATRIARKLATYFVSDDPPASLVARLEQAYLAGDTAIAPVLRELVDSEEFRDSVDAKLRTPGEDLVATYRLRVAELAQPASSDSAANVILWQASGLGQQPMVWPRPDGAPLTAATWASPSRALASLNLHANMAGGWWPTEDITYHPPADWTPTLPIAFRDLVDHLARLLHHRPSTASVLEGACLATGTSPDTTVTSGSDLFTWRAPQLLAALLDHPTWYRR
ncbi:DUF1800 domain-containing protein [Nocardioides sp.]|uniref:DUF1800 domain-containing protein n=1 Tax=Nocardioides sp. TaxID=35761 RepID=UPI0039E5E923